MICPLKEDRMPTVVAEAMMYGVPCLVSDSIGTASYVKDGFNGFVFHNGDEEEMTRKIAWYVTYKKSLSEMGKRAGKEYETHFSMDVYETNLLAKVCVVQHLDKDMEMIGE